jgi:large subunit ribosomal protein L15
MFLQNNLISIPGSRHRTKRVGRGIGSQRGTYSGKGNKGQLSRGSGKLHPTFTGQGGRSRFILGIPKKRGFKSRREKAATISLNLLNIKFEDGEMVNGLTLFEKNILDNKNQPYKIVGTAKLTKKLTFDPNTKFSKTVTENIK